MLIKKKTELIVQQCVNNEKAQSIGRGWWSLKEFLIVLAAKGKKTKAYVKQKIFIIIYHIFLQSLIQLSSFESAQFDNFCNARG